MRGNLSYPSDFLVDRVQDVATKTYATPELTDPTARSYLAMRRYGYVACEAIFNQTPQLHSFTETMPSAGSQTSVAVHGPLEKPPGLNIVLRGQDLEDVLLRKVVYKKASPVLSRILGGLAFKGRNPASTLFEVMVANVGDFNGVHASSWAEVATFSDRAKLPYTGDNVATTNLTRSLTVLGEIVNANSEIELPEPREVVGTFFKELSEPVA